MNAFPEAIQSITLRPCQKRMHLFYSRCMPAPERTEWPSLTGHNHKRMLSCISSFTAQHQYYVVNYPGAQFLVIFCDDQPIGRLYIHKKMNEILIMDIALLPEYRNAGIGSSIIRDLQGEARVSGSLVTHLHVKSSITGRLTFIEGLDL